MREWQYWTRNKLGILAGYLPAFNKASKTSSERLYIDLMAGEPFNRDKETGEEFDGSARLAMSSTPPFFTRIALCEMPQNAAALEKDLRAKYPGRNNFKVYPGKTATRPSIRFSPNWPSVDGRPHSCSRISRQPRSTGKLSGRWPTSVEERRRPRYGR